MEVACDKVVSKDDEETKEPALSYVRPDDPRAEGMEPGVRGPPSLLGEASRHDAQAAVVSQNLHEIPDLGDLVVVLLASTLAGLRDRLHEDGFEAAADLVADLVDVADAYVTARDA